MKTVNSGYKKKVAAKVLEWDELNPENIEFSEHFRESGDTYLLDVFYHSSTVNSKPQPLIFWTPNLRSFYKIEKNSRGKRKIMLTLAATPGEPSATDPVTNFEKWITQIEKKIEEHGYARSGFEYYGALRDWGDGRAPLLKVMLPEKKIGFGFDTYKDGEYATPYDIEPGDFVSVKVEMQPLWFTDESFVMTLHCKEMRITSFEKN
jgi:hypothetical protein